LGDTACMARASFQAADGIQPEQRWAYRARQVDELVEVSVVRLGTQRPARVLVRKVRWSHFRRDHICKRLRFLDWVDPVSFLTRPPSPFPDLLSSFCATIFLSGRIQAHAVCPYGLGLARPCGLLSQTVLIELVDVGLPGRTPDGGDPDLTTLSASRTGQALTN
jgi:hypothetical protein